MRWSEASARVYREASKRIERLAVAAGFDPAKRELEVSRPRAPIPGSPPEAAHQPQTARFFFSPADIPKILELLRARFPNECEDIVTRAERICRHQFDLLESGGLSFSIPIDWHLDPVRRTRAPLKPWYGFRSRRDGADYRLILALNRHGHLITLAKAHLLTRAPEFLTELLDEWRSWQRQNPYPLGVNWSRQAEVALRSLAWLWVGRLIAASPLAPKGFQHELLRGLAASARHIERYLDDEKGDAGVLSEASALFFTGALCPRLRSAERWRELGWQLVNAEAERRVAPVRTSLPGSLGAAVFGLRLFMAARILAARNDYRIPPALDQAIEQELNFLAGSAQAGFPPRWGRDEETAFGGPRSDRLDQILGPLSTGAAIYGRSDFKFAASGLKEETVWLLGSAGAEQFDALRGQTPEPASIAFPERGFYIMSGGSAQVAGRPARDGGHGQERAQLAVAVTPSPNPGRFAGTLGAQLSICGREWIVDPGWSAGGTVQAPCESVSSVPNTNTLLVDGKTSQSIMQSPAAPLWIACRSFDVFEALRPGNDDSNNPAGHRRTILHLKGAFWFVCDRAEGSGEHALSVSWQFSPDFTPHYTPPGFTFTFAGGVADPVVLAIIPAEGHGWSQELARGQVTPPGGGMAEPAPALRFSKRGLIPAEFAAVLQPTRSREDGQGRLSRSDGDGVVRYVYERAGSVYCIFLSARAGEWEIGGWKSDARFVIVSATGRQSGVHSAVCLGSFLEIDGRPVLTSDRPVEWCEVAGGEIRSSDSSARVSFNRNDLVAALGSYRSVQTYSPPTRRR